MVGAATLNLLGALEVAQRRLHPPEIPELRQRVDPFRARLDEALGPFRDAEPPGPLAQFHDRFVVAADRAVGAATLFVEDAGPQDAISRVLGSVREHCRALESLYALHRLPPISRFFVEEPFHDDLESLDPDPPEGVSVGIHQTGRAEGGDEGGAARGGFALYVPERYDGSRALPLVVALHGGSGNGRDFLWTWLREARGRQFMVLAPTARGQTWALQGPDVDAAALAAMVELVGERWNLDREHVLLTGLSDGATYTFLAGLRDGTPYTHLAPVSGVFHPSLGENGAIAAAAGRKIYLVHGALDWMFPVDVARMANDALAKAGAEVTFREIDDLSHTYPREENDRILEWFDPRLALPRKSADA